MAVDHVTASTIGLKNVVIAPLVDDTDTEFVPAVYGEATNVKGAVTASITPNNADPDIQYADDIEFDKTFPDPNVTVSMAFADLPLAIQAMILDNKMDDNGVLIRTATDKPKYFAIGFKSEKTNHHYRYVWLYKASAKPITENYQTKEGETVTRQNGNVEFTAIKRTFDQKWQAMADDDVEDFTADKAGVFLTGVYESSVEDDQLTALTIGSETLTPTFDGGKFYYEVTASGTSAAVTATAASDIKVELYANGTAIAGGASVTWETGVNWIGVRCTNLATNLVTSYAVKVTKS